MSLWETVRRLLQSNTSYAVIWREQAPGATVMHGEPIDGKSDADAISLVRARFMHIGYDWAYWVLYRANDTMVTAEQGPKFAKWPGDFAHIATDSHVLHTLESVRRHREPVSRPLHKVKLKSRGQTADSDRE
jgi:hypothetical protein